METTSTADAQADPSPFEDEQEPHEPQPPDVPGFPPNAIQALLVR